jgi:hypothetical protein
VVISCSHKGPIKTRILQYCFHTNQNQRNRSTFEHNKVAFGECTLRFTHAKRKQNTKPARWRRVRAMLSTAMNHHTTLHWVRPTLPAYALRCVLTDGTQDQGESCSATGRYPHTSTIRKDRSTKPKWASLSGAQTTTQLSQHDRDYK